MLLVSGFKTTPNALSSIACGFEYGASSLNYRLVVPVGWLRWIVSCCFKGLVLFSRVCVWRVDRRERARLDSSKRVHLLDKSRWPQLLSDEPLVLTSFWEIETWGFPWMPFSGLLASKNGNCLFIPLKAFFRLEWNCWLSSSMLGQLMLMPPVVVA